MSKPFVVSVPHDLGRDEARRRLADGLRWADEKYGAFLSIKQQSWIGDVLAFHAAALGQAANGTLSVTDTDVTVAVELPWLLARFAEKAQTLLQKQGTLLLEKK